MHGKIKKVFFRVIHYAIMVMITVLMLMPIGWMLGTSMRQSKESFVLPPSFLPNSTWIILSKYFMQFRF